MQTMNDDEEKLGKAVIYGNSSGLHLQGALPLPFKKTPAIVSFK